MHEETKTYFCPTGCASVAIQDELNHKYCKVHHFNAVSF